MNKFILCTLVLLAISVDSSALSRAEIRKLHYDQVPSEIADQEEYAKASGLDYHCLLSHSKELMRQITTCYTQKEDSTVKIASTNENRYIPGKKTSRSKSSNPIEIVAALVFGTFELIHGIGEIISLFG